MRIAVIGAGIVGVSTAHQLAVEGHEVWVFERSGGVATEASFATAGVIGPGALSLTPLTGPLSSPISGPTVARLAWRWQQWRQSRSPMRQPLAAALQSLAGYSFEQHQLLRQQLSLDYEHTQGHLLLLRSARDLAAARPVLAQLEQHGIAHQWLDTAQCRRAEPGLNAQTPLHGGVLLAQSEVGNCRQFALLLRQQAQRQGVRFRFHTTVQRIEPGPGPQVQHLYSPPAESVSSTWREADNLSGPPSTPPANGPVLERFDAVVLCTGAETAALLKPLGLTLPLHVLWGYSITAPLRQIEAHPDFGPRAALVDAQHQVTISRIGQRVRVSGGAELSPPAERMDTGQIERLHKVLHDWFPGATQTASAQRWRGARLLTPDGAPLLGASAVPGVWLNSAHGNHGWALACGAAQVLAAQISGRKTAIDVEPLAPSRLR